MAVDFKDAGLKILDLRMTKFHYEATSEVVFQYCCSAWQLLLLRSVDRLRFESNRRDAAIRYRYLLGLGWLDRR